MRHKYDFSPFFSFCHNNVIFLCNKVGLFVAFSCSTGLWYRTLILSFLIWVLFFALNDCFWKWLKNECANPGEARQTWRGAVRTLVRRDKPEEARYKPWRRLPSPPDCLNCRVIPLMIKNDRCILSFYQFKKIKKRTKITIPCIWNIKDNLFNL